MLKPIIACAAFVLAFSPAAAEDQIPQAVKDACRGDYEKNCAMHKPASVEARDCMADAFEKLSDGCVSAIIDSNLADEPTQADGAKSEVAQQGETAAPAKAKARVVRHASANKPSHGAKRTKVAHVRGAKRPKSVAGYIKRGTKLADFYVAKYTKIAFAKAFH